MGQIAGIEASEGGGRRSAAPKSWYQVQEKHLTQGDHPDPFPVPTLTSIVITQRSARMVFQSRSYLERRWFHVDLSIGFTVLLVLVVPLGGLDGRHDVAPGPGRGAPGGHHGLHLMQRGRGRHPEVRLRWDFSLKRVGRRRVWMLGGTWGGGCVGAGWV